MTLIHQFTQVTIYDNEHHFVDNVNQHCKDDIPRQVIFKASFERLERVFCLDSHASNINKPYLWIYNLRPSYLNLRTDITVSKDGRLSPRQIILNVSSSASSSLYRRLILRCLRAVIALPSRRETFSNMMTPTNSGIKNVQLSWINDNSYHGKSNG